jgi:hypothetical protein
VKNPANGAAALLSGASADSVTPLLQLLVDSVTHGAAAARVGVVGSRIVALRCWW